MPILPGTVTVADDGTESSAANSSTAKIIYEAFLSGFQADNGMGLPAPSASIKIRKGLAILANRIGSSVALPRRTPVADVDYVALISDVLIAKTAIGGANDDITLPNALKDGRIITIKDESGTCAVGKTITIVPASGTINGGANYVMNTAWQSVRVYSNFANWFTV